MEKVNQYVILLGKILVTVRPELTIHSSLPIIQEFYSHFSTYYSRNTLQLFNFHFKNFCREG